MLTTIRRGLGRNSAATALVVSALLAVAALAATAAMADTSQEQQGAKILGDIQAGKLTCKSLTTDDFDRIGNYVMGRMLGTPAAHEAMDRQMIAMMGASGEKQAHVFMGQRFAGCAGGRVPQAFGSMMGMMGAGMMGSSYGGNSSSTMMGSRSRGTGGMMGFGYGSPTGDRSSSDWSSGDIVMVFFMGLLIVLVIGTLVAWRPWQQQVAQSPLDILQARYARGEIDDQEFERCCQALRAKT